VARTLTARPDRMLGHLIDRTREQRLTGPVDKATYRTFRLPLQRPDDGSSAHTVACELCGQRVRVRLYSVAHTVRLRRRWLGLCGAGLVVLGLAVFSGFGPHPVLPDTAGLALLSAFAAAVGFAAAVAGFTAYRVEDGVRMLKPTARPQHNLLQPGRLGSRA
jgi:hypothetical protein